MEEHVSLNHNNIVKKLNCIYKRALFIGEQPRQSLGEEEFRIYHDFTILTFNGRIY